jgi:hypothetical protein
VGVGNVRVLEEWSEKSKATAFKRKNRSHHEAHPSTGLRAPDTKGSDINTPKLRALRDLRGEVSVPALIAALPQSQK